MPKQQERIITYSNADEGVAPDSASLRYPWTKSSSGTPTTTTATTGWTLSATGGDLVYYARQFFEGDSVAFAFKQRSQNTLEFQVDIEVSALSGSSVVFITFYDGAKTITLVIGDTIYWLDGSGLLRLIADPFGKGQRHSFHIIKHATERWELRVDGRFAHNLPYDAAQDTNITAQVVWGVISDGSTVTAVFQAPEMSCNMPLAPRWKVEKAFMELPPSVQDRYTPQTRALQRAMVGEMECGPRLRDQLAWEKTGGAIPDKDLFFFGGTVDPGTLFPAWTRSATYVTTDGLRVYSNGASGDASIKATFDTTATAGGLVFYARTRLFVAAYTAGTDGLVCHAINLRLGGASVSASIYETPGATAGTQWGITLREGDDTIAGSLTGRYWPVQIYDLVVAEGGILVELVSVGTSEILLLVDGAVVDWLAWADVTTSDAGAAEATLSGGDGTADGGKGQVYFWDATVGMYGYDTSRRGLFDQLCVEDLVFVGGCEPNQVLDTFHRHRWGMLELRGSSTGMLMDLRRLACTKHVYLIQELTPSGWILDYTFPDITPTWLDAPGDLQDIYVEIAGWPPNFTLSGWGDFCYSQIVTLSVIEQQFWICLIAVATATASAGSSVNIAVQASMGFEVGDVVKVRTFDNTTSEEATVSAVPDSTHITVDVIANTYTFATATPPIIRKVIRGAHP